MMEEEDEETILFDERDFDTFDEFNTDDDQAALLNNQVKELNFRQGSQPMSKRMKIFETLSLCAAFFGLGLCLAIPGPTLLDLQQQTNTDTETISRIFTGRSVGYLLGTVVSGMLFDCINHNVLLMFGLLLTATGTALAPWCVHFSLLALVFAFQGISMGILDTAGNTMCLQIWGKGNGPWMQGLHFAFGLGAFVAPLLAEPFLSPQIRGLNVTDIAILDTQNDSVLNHNPLFLSGRERRFSNRFNVIPDDFGNKWTHDSDNIKHDSNLQDQLSHQVFYRNQEAERSQAKTVFAQDIAEALKKRSEVSMDAPRRARIKRQVTEELTTDSDTVNVNQSETTTPVVTSTTQAASTILPHPKIAGKSTSNAAEVASGKILKHVDDIQPASSKDSGGSPNEIMPPPELDDAERSDNSTTNSTLEEGEVSDIGSDTSVVKSSTAVDTPSTTVSTTTSATTTTTTTSTTTKTTTASTSSKVENTEPPIPNSRTTPSHTTLKTKHSHRPNVTGESFGDVSVKKVKEKVQKLTTSVTNAFNSFSTVQFAYLLIAAYIFCVTILFGFVLCLNGCTLRARQIEDPETRYSRPKESKGFRCQTLLLLFIFYFLYVGMEITYAGLLLTFTVKQLHFSKSKGSMVTSVFWGFFAASRGLSIFLARCCSASVMLILDLVLTNAAAVALVFALESNPNVIWYASAVLGTGMASIFPTGITWAERYMEVTGKSTAIFVVGSALGEMCLPALTGFLFEAKNPMWLMYILMGSAIICTVVYIIMQNIASNYGVRYSEIKAYNSSLLSHDDHMDVEMRGVPLRSDFYDEQNEGQNRNVKKNKSNRRVTFDLTDDAKSARERLGRNVQRSILKVKEKFDN